MGYLNEVLLKEVAQHNQGYVLNACLSLSLPEMRAIKEFAGLASLATELDIPKEPLIFLEEGLHTEASQLPLDPADLSDLFPQFPRGKTLVAVTVEQAEIYLRDRKDIDLLLLDVDYTSEENVNTKLALIDRLRESHCTVPISIVTVNNSAEAYKQYMQYGHILSVDFTPETSNLMRILNKYASGFTYEPSEIRITPQNSPVIMLGAALLADTHESRGNIANLVYTTPSLHVIKLN